MYPLSVLFEVETWAMFDDRWLAVHRDAARRLLPWDAAALGGADNACGWAARWKLQLEAGLFFQAPQPTPF